MASIFTPAPEHLIMFSAQMFLENFGMNPWARYRGDEVEAEPGNPEDPTGFLRTFTTKEELECFYRDFTPTKSFTKYNFGQVFMSLVKHHRVVKEKDGKLVWGYWPKTESMWVPM